MLHISSLRAYILQACRRNVIFSAIIFSGRNSYFEFFFVRFGLQIDLPKNSIFLARVVDMLLMYVPATNILFSCQLILWSLQLLRVLARIVLRFSLKDMSTMNAYIYIYMCISLYIYIYITALVKDCSFPTPFML